MNSVCGENQSSEDAFGDFLAKLQKLRNSPEQIALQVKAARKAMLSNLAFFFFGVTFVAALGSLILHVRWFIVLVVGGLSLSLFRLSKRLTRESLIIAKKQDREYVMSGFRVARNIDEMNWAGWFQYLPEMEIGQGFDQALSDMTAVKEIDRVRRVFAQKSSFEERLCTEKAGSGGYRWPSGGAGHRITHE